MRKKFFSLLLAIMACTGMQAVPIFSEPFDNGIGDFTIENKTLPSGLSYVWKWQNAQYGMVASAYVSGTKYATESWLISPAIPLKDFLLEEDSNPQLSFDHAVNKGTPSAFSVKISKDNGSTWENLSISNWPAGTNWNFVNATADLNNYREDTIRIAFCYVSSSSVAPQWEIKNFKINASTATVKIGDLYYYLKSTIYNTTAKVVSDRVGNEKYTDITTIDIPTKVSYLGYSCDVYSIEDSAFYNCTSLTSVTIGARVSIIGKSAFENCTSLTSVMIGNSVTSIGDNAFYGCIGLTSVVIPHRITSIGESAFYGCSGLTSVTIPNSVTSIKRYTFYGCSGLTSITIPVNVTTIGEGAFHSCSGLTAITSKAVNPPTCTGEIFANVNKTIPLYVPAESVDAYKNANVWKEFTQNIQASKCLIASGITGAYITWELSCDSILTISGYGPMEDYKTVEGAIISQTDWFRYYKNAIISVVIEDGITRIGDYAFYGCSNLTSIEIPNSVTSIGKFAFVECRNLKAVYISDIAKWCHITCNGPSANPLNVAHMLYLNGTLVTDLVIPNSVTSIGEYAFAGCRSLTSLTISNSVTAIRDGAFYGCSNLTSIEIPNSVTNIGSSTFEDCRGLTSVSIGNSVTSIGSRAFAWCSRLTSAEIGSGTTNIGDSAFYNTNLISLSCKATTPPICGNSNVFYSVDRHIPLFVPAESIDAYKAADVWKEFTNILEFRCITASGTFDYSSKFWVLTCEGELIISGIGIMDSYSYYANDPKVPWYNNRSSIISIVVKEGITSIGNGAFEECSNLTSIEIPNSVTSIGIRAFSGCSSLSAIEIPNSVTNIEKDAFSRCSGLTSLTIGNSVTNIEMYAFAWCTSLTSVTIPNSVTSIGTHAFYGCSSLTSIDVVADNTNYCSIEGVLFSKDQTSLIRYPCGKLGAYIIPNSVTSIGSSAFSGCRSLTSVTIPNSVTSIGENAFYECTKLTSITCEAVTPPTCEGSSYYVFYMVRKSIPLYVPAESVEAYKAADGWKEFSNIRAIGDIETAVENVPSDQVPSDQVPSTKAQKILHNGQIYILRGEKVYDMTGQEVK